MVRDLLEILKLLSRNYQAENSGWYHSDTAVPSGLRGNAPPVEREIHTETASASYSEVASYNPTYLPWHSQQS